MSPALHFQSARPDADADAIDFEVADGSFTVLLGARRSADPAIPMAVGLRTVWSGRVLVLGEDLMRLQGRAMRRLRHRLGVGMNPGGLLSNQSLRNNVLVPLVYGGMTARAAARAADEVLEACGITSWAGARPMEVGEEVRQTAVIARALARRPELLLLEDPCSALDTTAAEGVLEQCRQAAGTVFVTTHRHDPTLLARADAVVR